MAGYKGNTTMQRTLEHDAERYFAFYESRCSKCEHPETEHDVDGDCLDGACSHPGCRCGQFQEVVI